ncbi:nucleoside recognition domain-containing protein [Paenibacillus humicola]|uniref:nucleoside recognition domain-containing protein n=1 Tax=Paenibacillus humicola TaxID=3110540 RepID=UPI00237B2DBC|nr:nucleoside recognition domain-containing protein [Paenibacillus humicola]
MTRTLTYACLSLLLVAAIVYRPDDAFQASLQGLTVWWNIVFPGLLPFLTLMELMLAFGAVHALGVFFDPLMRRLFRLPGEAGFAVAAGWTGGFPAGAEAAAALRRREAVTRGEGQRLLALAHMPSPLFMLLVVGAGFFRRPELGAAVACAVWLAAFAAAFAGARLARRGKDGAPGEGRPIPGAAPGIGLLRQAASAMAKARALDGRTFGKALGDSVTAAVYKLLAVGGLMMFGAVIVRLLEPLVPDAVPALLLPGLLESHIGAYAAAAAQLPGGIALNAAAAAAVLGWGGVSALLQAGSAVAGTDLSLAKLAAARLAQSALAAALLLGLWRPLTGLFTALSPAAAPVLELEGAARNTAAPAAIHAASLASLWAYAPLLIAGFGAVLLLLAAVSALAGVRGSGAARR